MTHLCVSLKAENPAAALQQAAGALAAGADRVEYRIDRIAGGSAAVAELVRASPLPCLVTCRPTWEGGESSLADDARMDLLEAAAGAGAAAIDIELATLEKSPALRARVRRTAGKATRLVLSTHDFQGRPADLQRRVRAMVEEPACDIVKAAWQARSVRDNCEAFELLTQTPKPAIALCMGAEGLPSRVLAGKFGAWLTFCALEPGGGTAPGQVDVQTMLSLYRWKQITPRTRVYGVIGHPVGHSLSPLIHNAGFDATGHDGVYLPLPVGPEYERFKAAMICWLEHPGLDFRGASVTIPHKENLLKFVRDHGGRIEPLAEKIGAANTLTVHDDGSLAAANTDYAAARDSVCDALAIRPAALKDLRIGVIGAGGAARAVVAAFTEAGARVVIYNRSLDRARELADDFKEGAGQTVAMPLEKLADTCCSVLIHCTPVGMHPHVEATPLPHWPQNCGRDTLVFDTIYNPLRTRLLQEAEARGCRTVSGVEMFVRQAAAQFTGWTGRPAPVDLFRSRVLARLGA